MKLQKLILLITVSQILFSCGKNDDANKKSTQKEKPHETTQPPNNTNEPEKNIDKDLKKGNKSLDNFNTNLFEKYCYSNGTIFTKCDFKNIKLLPYSNPREETLNYKINYAFENCNFDKLNLEFFSNSGVSKIISGNKIIKLSGYSLNMRDTYFWDTNTNEYNQSCSFVIKEIETSFSDYTNNKINIYIKTIKEHKQFIEDLNEISYLLNKFKFLISNLNKTNVIHSLNEIKQNIMKAKKEHTNDIILKFILEDIENELEIFENANPLLSDTSKIDQIKIKLLPLVASAIQMTDTNELSKNINLSRSKLNSILNMANSIPNFNSTELQEFKNKLAAL